jgi:Cu/Ag efflux pump CusA
MIDRILEFSLRQRLLVLLGAIGLAAAGIFAALHLPIDAVPDITNAQAAIVQLLFAFDSGTPTQKPFLYKMLA